MQWGNLVYRSADVMGRSCREGVEGEKFLKQGLKQGLLMHSE